MGIVTDTVVQAEMEQKNTPFTIRCDAMVRASITDPMSKDGIDFCVKNCPYTYCVALEPGNTQKHIRYRQRTYVAQELRIRHVSVEDIALILRTSIRNVLRYLKD